MTCLQAGILTAFIIWFTGFAGGCSSASYPVGFELTLSHLNTAFNIVSI